MDNPANFGRGCRMHCICEAPGQVPCPSLVPLPKNYRGKYRFQKPDELWCSSLFDVVNKNNEYNWHFLCLYWWKTRKKSLNGEGFYCICIGDMRSTPMDSRAMYTPRPKTATLLTTVLNKKLVYISSRDLLEENLSKLPSERIIVKAFDEGHFAWFFAWIGSLHLWQACVTIIND